MRLPNLLIAGAPKSGTSALFNLLGQHPDIFRSKMKEPKFFVSGTLNQIEEPIVRWIDTFEEYKELYKDGQEHSYIVDASAFYLTFYQEAIPKIKETLGDPNILIILRNPVKRAFSAYKHMRRNNPQEKDDFFYCISDDRRKVNHPLMLYKEMGCYYEAVKSYQAAFSKVKVLIYEEFFEHPERHIGEIWDFLELKEVTVENKEVNKKPYDWKSKSVQALFQKNNILKELFLKAIPSSWKFKFKSIFFKISTKPQTMKLTEEEELLLKNFYKEDVDKLSKHLNKDLSIIWHFSE